MPDETIPTLDPSPIELAPAQAPAVVTPPDVLSEADKWHILYATDHVELIQRRMNDIARAHNDAATELEAAKASPAPEEKQPEIEPKKRGK